LEQHTPGCKTEESGVKTYPLSHGIILCDDRGIKTSVSGQIVVNKKVDITKYVMRSGYTHYSTMMKICFTLETTVKEEKPPDKDQKSYLTSPSKLLYSREQKQTVLRLVDDIRRIHGAYSEGPRAATHVLDREITNLMEKPVSKVPPPSWPPPPVGHPGWLTAFIYLRTLNPYFLTTFYLIDFRLCSNLV
jgi:hypothetical protein